MIIYPSSVTMTENNREIVQAQHADFPYAAIEARLNSYADRCVPWHWHDYFEFGKVQRGSVLLQLERDSFLLGEGDAYFANANVLHQMRAAQASGETLLRAQLFDRSLISGAGLIGRRYIAPVENCASLDAFLLLPGRPEHGELLHALDAAFALAEEDREGHEMEICARLNSAWHSLFRLVQPLLERGSAPSESSRRVKAMLTFIHENYGRSLTVREIAAAANIGERECFRCFAQVLDTTPTEYLIHRRVGAAARLLHESALPIGEIAAACGFADAAYFSRVFRRVLGCTPSRYRRQG